MHAVEQPGIAPALVLSSRSVKECLTPSGVLGNAEEAEPNMAHAALVLVALALVGSAGAAGFALHAMDASPNLVTVSGTVTSVGWNPHFNTSVEFNLTNGNGTYQVHTAPPWYWAEHNYPAIKVNDTVSVKGVFEDNSTTDLEAWSISINGGAWITLRTGDMPAWAQEKSGQSPEIDHDNETSTD